MPIDGFWHIRFCVGVLWKFYVFRARPPILRRPARILTSLVSASNFVITPFGKADLLIMETFKPESKSTQKSLWLLIVPIVSAVQIVTGVLFRDLNLRPVVVVSMCVVLDLVAFILKNWCVPSRGIGVLEIDMSNVERVGSTTKLIVSSSYSKAILWCLVLRGSCVWTTISNLTWLSVKRSGSLSGTKTYKRKLNFSTGTIPYFWVRFFLHLWSGEGGKNGIVFVRAMVMSIIVILGVRIPALGGCPLLAIILVDMMVVIAPAAWARARPRTRARRRS